LFVAVEVVRFEQAKGSFPLTGHAQFAQILDGQGEKTSQPFLFEKLLERFGRRNRSGIHHCRAEFLFRARKIQRDVRHSSAALLPSSGLVFVHHKAVHAEAQIGP